MRPVNRASGWLLLEYVVYLIGEASLYDGGMTDGEAGYLDIRCSSRSAGVSFGLAEFGCGAVESVEGIS